MTNPESEQTAKNSDNMSDDELSKEDREMIQNAVARLKKEQDGGTEPSEARKRLHDIWQMESEYFNRIRKINKVSA